jgi:hypothetical protein
MRSNTVPRVSDQNSPLAAFTNRLLIANRISGCGQGIVTARGRNTPCKLIPKVVCAVAGLPCGPYYGTEIEICQNLVGFTRE